MSDRGIRSVCVVGDGIVGLSAAAAFARALPGVVVAIVPAEPDSASVAEIQCATWPDIHRFHAAIGLTEPALVRDGIATPLLGAQFVKWPHGSSAWIHGFGEHGLKAGDIPFHTLWQRAFRAGNAAPYWRHGAAAVLGAEGRFVPPSRDPASPLGGFLYALRLDPPRYRTELAACPVALRRHARFAGVEYREDGGIAAVATADGERVTADLFIDASGAQALLQSPGVEDFEPWSDWLPGRTMRQREDPTESGTPLDQATTHERGWCWSSPLADRTVTIEIGGQEDGAPLRFGRRTPWVGNRLAIGDAATAIDPLFGTALHLAHDAILLAIGLLPGRDFAAVELAEYNRRTQATAERMRDLHALHYLYNQAVTSPPPAGLARTIEQFTRRGRLPPSEADPFETDAWLAALVGLGFAPEGDDPLAESVDADRAADAMAALAGRLADAADAAPPYPQWLARIRAG